jgi:hypothetical protein
MPPDSCCLAMDYASQQEFRTGRGDGILILDMVDLVRSAPHFVGWGR